MRASLLATLLLLAACAVPGGEGASGTDNPYAVLDAYAVAHGMAVSYVTSRHASPVVVEQLARLDARAAQAVRSLQRMPSDSGQEQASAAVAALTGYAARQANTSTER